MTDIEQFDKKNSRSCILGALPILFIPLMFLVGLVFAYLGYFPINVDLHTLAIVGFIFITFVSFIQHNANYAVCHIKNSFGNMEEGLQNALRSNALTIMGKTKSTLNVKDFISSYYQDIRNDNFAKVAPSVFPMLGILGTFIAIALSMPDFTAKDTGALDREISLLLSGIGTAFYASIYGILLSLIWTYFEKRGIAKVDRQIFELEKLYNKRVWKQSELIKHQHMQSELKDQEIVKTLKDMFNMDFIKQLNDQYLKNFTTIMSDTTHSFSKLTVHLQEASSELRETLDNIETKKDSLLSVENMASNIQGFNYTAQNLQKSLDKFDTSIDHTFVNIDKELAQSIDKLSTFSRLLAEQNQSILSDIASKGR